MSYSLIKRFIFKSYKKILLIFQRPLIRWLISGDFVELSNYSKPTYVEKFMDEKYSNHYQPELSIIFNNTLNLGCALSEDLVLGSASLAG